MRALAIIESMNRLIVLTLLALLAFVPPGQAWYPRLKREMIVTPETTIVGHNRTYIPAPQETLVELAMRAGLGFDNLMQANPGVDPWSPPPGREIVLPSAVLLPSGIRTGITINLAELRLYLMWDDGGVRKVRIYPVGIGREGWATPLGAFHIDTNGFFPPVCTQKVRRLSGVIALGILKERRTPAAGIVTPCRVFNFDHIGTEIRQHLTGPGASQNARQIQHLKVRQCAHQNAGISVWVRPRISACTSWVPS